MPARRIALALLLAAVSLHAQNSEPAHAPYYIAFLRPDPARKPLAKEDADRIMSAHMANIFKMAEDGLLASAGPFDDEHTTISGIFIFKVESLAKAQSIANQDPTVVEHRNTIDVHQWNGPDGLGDEYFRLHRLDPKTPENMQKHPFCILLHGAAWDASSPQQASILAAHEQYLTELRSHGKLGAAGSIDASGDLVALVIFRVIPQADAQALLASDPAVMAGVLRVENHTWWSSDHVLPW